MYKTAALVVATVLSLIGSRLDAQRDSSGVRIAAVPQSLPTATRDSLNRRQAALQRRVDSLNAAANEFNVRCRSLSADDGPAIARCQSELTQLRAVQAEINIAKLQFNEAVRVASERGLRIVAPPSPTLSPVAGEQARLDQDPRAWYAAQHARVRAAVALNKRWTREVLAAIGELREPSPQYRLTKLADLTPGDILLVAPTDLSRATAGDAVSYGILGVDYLVRAWTDLTGGQQMAPASHALTFVRNVNGTLLFLDHTHKGSRILDQRAFLREYGAREMYVARPQAVVDGRELWSAARSAALQRRSDYGLFGEKVVCSERAGLAVARATGTRLSSDRSGLRFGQVDITPGDFFDTQGGVGKNFVVTRLRTPGVPRAN